ncbi:fumarylacetoacetate hydrolase [Candidatus Koribacter versatilis Ellin345]|uniref:fumarylacetoacetase n=1 Tax=Koribacter versatilis (strain Ellin345) TaxID=204669 RepID=Q1IQ42_KORVE|nr:fumarylacetoacetase [Candidatus Koribacter versatilis]ABF41008.1 fumarylacetoacetate hydrolase [Candidatus Koribacter versatilis Ellin345]
MNETHDPKIKSWVASANAPDCDFPLQNLPFGVFRRKNDEGGGIGVAIGDQVFDVGAWVRDQGKSSAEFKLLTEKRLNRFLAAGPQIWSAARMALFNLLREDSPQREQVARYLDATANVEMEMPIDIGDYTDFYASVFHATNVGSMFRPDNPLLPNYKWVPIGYHGRASSVVASGAAVKRPSGQRKPPTADMPTFGPCAQLDYELEVGAVIGPGNALGETVPLRDAEKHIFGLCLLNDWSARDIQAWEYQPLGPFLAKNFVTTISPWLVTLEALEPYRRSAYKRPEGDPQPLPYLSDENDQQRGAFDVSLDAYLSTRKMRDEKIAPISLSHGSLRDMYWTFGQMLAHHASNGCNLQPGDLIGSGTVSGQSKHSRGCLLELSWRGTEPISLPSGETRKFLEDGDEVIFRGYAEREGQARIGFGECRGIVVG